MSSKLLVGQKLTSEDGFAMIEVITDQHGYTSTPTVPIVRDLKKWCRETCGTWAHTETFSVSTLVKNRHKVVLKTLFAFQDEEDRLAAILKIGDNGRLTKLWSSSIKFNIYVKGD